MRKLLTIATLLCFSLINAQETKEQKELLNKMSDDACEQLEKIDLSKKMTKDELTAELGIAILPVYTKYSKEIKKHYGLSTSSSEDAHTMGRMLGERLVLRCDKMVAITKMLLEDKEFMGEVKERLNDKKVSSTQITGKVNKVETDEFYSVYISTDGGDIIKLVYLFDTDGSGLIPDALKSKSGKQLSIIYHTATMYYPQQKEFRQVKIIDSVEAL